VLRLSRILVVLCLLAPLALVAVPAGASGAAPIEPAVLETLGATSAFVHANQGRLAEAIRAAELAGLDVAQRYEAIEVFNALGTSGQFRALAASGHIEWIESNQRLQVATDSSHRATRSEDLYLGEVNGTSYDGTGVGVAVVDTGVDGTIPALQPALSRGTNIKILCPIPGAVIRLATVSMSGCPVDTVTVEMEDTDTVALGGHGTHVAGIIAGAETTVVPTDTTQPTVSARGSAPGSALYSIGAGALLSVDNAMDGLEWVLNNHDLVSPAIKVVNNSWGTSYEEYRDPDDPSQPTLFTEDGYRLHRALWKMQDALVDEGVTLVFAAGNSGGGLGAVPTTMAGCINPTPGVICVANYNDLDNGSRDGVIDGSSSRGQRTQAGTWPDIAAPGTNIISTCRPSLPVCATGAQVNDEYFKLSGTSMAAPEVAGIVAQMLQADPSLTPAEIEDLLEDTAHKFRWGSPYGRFEDPTNPDDESSFEKGHGLVDALAAVTGAESATEPPAAPDPVLYTASGLIPGQAATSFFEPTVASNSSVTRRAFEASCSPDVPPVDGFVFTIPQGLSNDRNILTLSGSNPLGLWDINMWLYDSSCTLIGSNQGGIFGDTSMRLPADTRYAVATNHFFGLTTVGATIQPPPLNFTGATTSEVQYSDSAMFAVLASTLDENALIDAPIDFQLGGSQGETWSAVTDGRGIASISRSLTLLPGDYTLTATYTGADPSLAGVSIERNLTILKEGLVLSVSVEGSGSKKTLVATLRDDDGTPVEGRSIAFAAQGQTIGEATTNGAGVARLAVPAAYRSGKVTFTASFCGDDYYRPTNCG
jgi:serine protease AprX